jgi:hypothetical protein
MLRIWSEFLPYAQAARPAVLDLLARWNVHPIVAVRPDADLAQLATLIQAARQRDLEIGIWPLLGREQGYWANERNAHAWSVATDRLLDVLESQDARPVWVAVDLEPPLDDVTSMLRDPLRLPGALYRFARRNLDAERFVRATDDWNRAMRGLASRGYRTLGITVPLAAHDLEGGEPLWQDLLETPWAGVGFDRHGIMAYNSMVAGYSRGLLSAADARAAHDRLVARLADHFAANAHVSIGLTGSGVLGDEPAYFEPAPLGRDAGAVRARQVKDIGIFCLEGLLDQNDPDSWLEAVVSASAMLAPQTRTSRAVRAVARLAPPALRALRRLPSPAEA